MWTCVQCNKSFWTDYTATDHEDDNPGHQTLWDHLGED
jgi:hypothetical protein